MRPSTLAVMALALMVASELRPAQASAARPQAVETLTGIPLDAQWKLKLYQFARDELAHPAWGWTHSERNYQLASEIAARETLVIDPDVLFAAAFTHDIGAIGEFQKEGVDHAVRSVEVAESWLREAGFPSEKLPAVKEAILGHMHDKQPGKSNEAIVLHDADTLDFLGSVGVARRLAVTGTATDYSGGVARIRDFADKLPNRLVTASAKAIAVNRVAEMRRVLTTLDAETANGCLP